MSIPDQISHSHLKSSGLDVIAAKVETGERLTFEDGVTLFRTDDILGLGYLANLVRERKNGNRAYYIINRHINHTNICKNRCRFCAFSRSEGEEGAYAMSVEQVLARAEELYDPLVSEWHLVGGLHPSFPLEYYTEMLSRLRERYPDVHLQAFTAVEIAHLAEMAKLSVRDCLIRLRDAGLGSLPGGGAEIFSPRVRQDICPEKLPGEEWLSVMRTAHELGIRSNATMLYGHVETDEEKADHLLRLRALQDETGGFMAFIPLAFHPRNTDLEADSAPATTGFMDLKMLAVGRLMLDNFPHVKTFWIMVGLKLAQVALRFGADDIDGTVVEEKITHMAGAETPQGLTEEQIVKLIRDAGREPVRRDTLYSAR